MAESKRKLSPSSDPEELSSSKRSMGAWAEETLSSSDLTVDLTHDPSSDKLQLSEAQFRTISMLLQRKSVFFTGAAGTGKSFIVQILRDVLRYLDLENRVAFTAPTGVAACNIEGTTIHSWAGIGLASEPVEKLVDKVRGSVNARNRWRRTEILVIDEISMLPADIFDMLSVIGSQIRADPRPFGGLQVVLCGDFFQLPPVKSPKFCFESKYWPQLLGDDGVVVLDKVFRQKDSLFQRLLNDMRRGVLAEANKSILMSRTLPYTLKNGIVPTLLYATNKGVDEINEQKLEAIDEEVVEYPAYDTGEEEFLAQLRNGMKAPTLLRLKIGAQVMLLKNVSVEEGLVNGARGVVTGFSDPVKTNFGMIRQPIVDFSVRLGGRETMLTGVMVELSAWDQKRGDKVLARREQIPLMLAWAISIHKSQGMTIPYLSVSFQGMFEFGQAYVALSRATDLNGLFLTNFNAASIKANEKVKRFYASLGYAKESEHDEEKTVITSVEELSQSFIKELPQYCEKSDWLTSYHTSSSSEKFTSKNGITSQKDTSHSEHKNVGSTGFHPFFNQSFSSRRNIDSNAFSSFEDKPYSNPRKELTDEVRRYCIIFNSYNVIYLINS